MKMLKNTLILTIITVIAGGLLGLVYEITKEPIRIAQDNAKKAAWQSVFPKATENDFEPVDVEQDIASDIIQTLDVNAEINEACIVKDRGYIVTTTSKDGYGGDVKITIGITNEGEISGVSFLSISESPGLGIKAKEPEYYNQYVGKTTDSFYVSKDGGDGESIDALSGATITSRAVTEAVNVAIAYSQEGF